MSLINSKPRFGYDDKEDTIFDYLTSKSIKVGEKFDSVDGTWDTVELKRLISTGQSFESALVKDKIDRADGDFDAELKAAERRQQEQEADARSRAAIEAEKRESERQTEQRRREAEEKEKAEQAERDESARLEAEEKARQQEAPQNGG